MCPRGWVTITKNAHITGQMTGCKSGKYAPLCAYDAIQKESFGTCYSTFSSQILSGGYSQRPDLEGRFGYHFLGDAGTPSRRTTQRDAAKAMLHGNDCRGTLPVGDLSVMYRLDSLLKTSKDPFAYRTTGSTRSLVQKDNDRIIVPDRSTTRKHTGLTEYDKDRRHPQLCFHHGLEMADEHNYALNACPSVEIEIGLLPVPKMCAASHNFTA